MGELLKKIRKGVENPRKVPPFLLGKLFPEFAARHGIATSIVDVRDEFITWRLGGFVQGPQSRPQFSARLYYEADCLQRRLDAVTSGQIDRALEIGCGYGRLTPWIDNFAAETHAIDPNESVIADAREQYSHITFEVERAENLPYPDDSFDLIVTWTVLQSIPPDAIHDVTAEIVRVLAPGGTLLIAEQVEKPDRNITWSRSEAEYERLLAPLELLESHPRPVESTFDPEYAQSAVYDETADRAYHPVERVMTFSRNATGEPR